MLKKPLTENRNNDAKQSPLPSYTFSGPFFSTMPNQSIDDVMLTLADKAQPTDQA